MVVEKRPKARDACVEEIERGFDLISSLPGVGEPVAHKRIQGIRRLLLGRIRYHLYYRLHKDIEAVEVLALWHTSRGSGPYLGGRAGVAL